MRLYTSLEKMLKACSAVSILKEVFWVVVIRHITYTLAPEEKPLLYLYSCTVILSKKDVVLT